MTVIGATGDSLPPIGTDAGESLRRPLAAPPDDGPGPVTPAGDLATLTGSGQAAQPDAADRTFDPNEVAVTFAAAKKLAAVAKAPPGTATPPVLPSPSEGILKGMNAKQRAAYEALSPDQRHAYVRVHYDLTSHKAQILMARMLESGKLLEKGADGKTLLDAIDRFAKTELAVPKGEEIVAYHQEALTTLVTQIGDPSTIDQGNAYNTCGATIVQYEFARTRPADYATFVTGLLSKSGESRLPNDPLGVRVNRLKDSLNRTDPKDNRDDLSRIVQAALMAAASPGYSNKYDNTGVTLPGDIRLGAAGLSGTMMTTLLNRIRKDDVAVLPRASLWAALDGGLSHGVNADEVMHGLQQEIDAQKQAGKKPVVVPTCFDIGDHDLHWVQVSKVTDDRVYFFNPHGDMFKDHKKDKNVVIQVEPGTKKRYIDYTYEKGPTVRLYEDGTQSMSRKDAEKRIEQTLVSESIAGERIGASPNNNWNLPF